MKSNPSSINGVSMVNGVSTVAVFTKRLCSTFGFAVLAAVWSANDPYKNSSQTDGEYPVD
jgi:hypothetical protein